MKKILCLIMAVVFSFGLLTVEKAEAATRFKVGSGSSCRVTLSRSILVNGRARKTANKYAKLSIGLTQLQSEVRINLYDGNGKYLTTWTAGHGHRFSLGNDHTSYIIKVVKHKQSGWASNTCYFYSPTYCSVY